jgi:hypothetical protein
MGDLRAAWCLLDGKHPACPDSETEIFLMVFAVGFPIGQR